MHNFWDCQAPFLESTGIIFALIFKVQKKTKVGNGGIQRVFTHSYINMCNISQPSDHVNHPFTSQFAWFFQKLRRCKVEVVMWWILKEVYLAQGGCVKREQANLGLFKGSSSFKDMFLLLLLLLVLCGHSEPPPLLHPAPCHTAPGGEGETGSQGGHTVLNTARYCTVMYCTVIYCTVIYSNIQ